MTGQITQAWAVVVVLVGGVVALAAALWFAHTQVRKANKAIASMRQEVGVALGQKKEPSAAELQGRVSELDKRFSTVARRTGDLELRLMSAESELESLRSITQRHGDLLDRLADAVEVVSKRLDLMQRAAPRVEPTSSLFQEEQREAGSTSTIGGLEDIFASFVSFFEGAPRAETASTPGNATAGEQKRPDGVRQTESTRSPYWNLPGLNPDQLSEPPLPDGVDLPESTEEVDEFMKRHVEYRLQKGFDIIRAKREG